MQKLRWIGKRRHQILTHNELFLIFWATYCFSEFHQNPLRTFWDFDLSAEEICVNLPWIFSLSVRYRHYLFPLVEREKCCSTAGRQWGKDSRLHVVLMMQVEWQLLQGRLEEGTCHLFGAFASTYTCLMGSSQQQLQQQDKNVTFLFLLPLLIGRCCWRRQLRASGGTCPLNLQLLTFFRPLYSCTNFDILLPVQ